MKIEVRSIAPPPLTWIELFKAMGGVIYHRRLGYGDEQLTYRLGGLVVEANYMANKGGVDNPETIPEFHDRHAHHILTNHGELLAAFTRKNRECSELRDDLLKHGS